VTDETIDPAVLPEVPPKPKSRRGFACMDPERRREIARKGGASVQAANRSFAKDKELAISAGSKGGSASRGGGRKRQEF
jgi:general stress protein YciG